MSNIVVVLYKSLKNFHKSYFVNNKTNKLIFNDEKMHTFSVFRQNINILVGARMKFSSCNLFQVCCFQVETKIQTRLIHK